MCSLLDLMMVVHSNNNNINGRREKEDADGEDKAGVKFNNELILEIQEGLPVQRYLNLENVIIFRSN